MKRKWTGMDWTLVILALAFSITAGLVVADRTAPARWVAQLRGTPPAGTTNTPRASRTPKTTPQSATDTPVPQPTTTDVGGTDVPTPTDTLTPSETPTGVPGASATPAPTAEPGANLLINHDFSNGFMGWSQSLGLWLIHDITGSQCAEDNPDWPLTMAEMDRDVGGGWPVGGEDYLWQEVQATVDHANVVLTYTEAHHMHTGFAEIRLFGSTDGTSWDLIWFRPEPEADWGVGHFCVTPPTFTHTFPSTHEFYKLEMHGMTEQFVDGWLICPCVLEVTE